METGLGIAATLGWFFNERGFWSEGLDWLERTIAANPDASDSLRATAHHSAGALAGQQLDQLRARGHCDQALALARAANDRWNIAWALSHMGIFAGYKPEQRAALLEESLALFRELGDVMGTTHTLVRRSWFVSNGPDFTYAHALLDEAAQLAREAGDKILLGWTYLELGRIARRQLDHRQMRNYLEMSLSLFREARFPNGYIRSLTELAKVEQALENWTRAQEFLEEMRIALRQSPPDNNLLIHVLIQLGSIARYHGQLERAATFMGAGFSPHLVGDAGPTVTSAESAYAVDTLLPAELGEAAFAEAWATGNAMTREQAVAYALEYTFTLNKKAATSDKAAQTSDLLNEREIEVLSLVADGQTNREIARELFLSVNTVKWYLKEIYGKLDVTNRTQAVARAQELGMLAHD